jgi:hypothetical protein
MSSIGWYKTVSSGFCSRCCIPRMQNEALLCMLQRMLQWLLQFAVASPRLCIPRMNSLRCKPTAPSPTLSALSLLRRRPWWSRAPAAGGGARGGEARDGRLHHLALDLGRHGGGGSRGGVAQPSSVDLEDGGDGHGGAWTPAADGNSSIRGKQIRTAAAPSIRSNSASRWPPAAAAPSTRSRGTARMRQWGWRREDGARGRRVDVPTGGPAATVTSPTGGPRRSALAGATSGHLDAAAPRWIWIRRSPSSYSLFPYCLLLPLSRPSSSSLLRLVLLPPSRPAAGANYHERCARGSARPLQALLVCATGTSANGRFLQMREGGLLETV